MKRDGYNWPGVYVFRTRRPGLLGRVPVAVYLIFCGMFLGLLYAKGLPLWLGAALPLLSPRQTAYVGEGRTRSRYRDHLQGNVRYNAMPKPWSDLAPSHYWVPLPYWKPLLRTVEALVIALLWPVYNHQKNLWNPRRIPLRTAKRQRGQRDLTGWSFNCRPAHLAFGVVLVTVIYANRSILTG